MRSRQITELKMISQPSQGLNSLQLYCDCS
jgi:hypothetical protein